MIHVQNLCKSYGRIQAVKQLSFNVHPGQILGLVGRNGAGKTTTLRLIAGMIPASAGAASVCGHSLHTESLQAKRHLAYIPDEPQLFEALTVAEHLEFIRSAYQISDATEDIDRLLRTFELIEKRHVPAEELSRGMRQKLGICCAYLHQPSAILFDEPLVGLDPHGIRNVKDSMVARAHAGAAVVISSHMLAMVEDICTHILILEQGTMCFYGTVTELRELHAEDHHDASLEAVFLRATSRNDVGQSSLRNLSDETNLDMQTMG